MEARRPVVVLFHLLVRLDDESQRSTFQQGAVLKIGCIEGANQAIGGEQAKSQIIENGQGAPPQSNAPNCAYPIESMPALWRLGLENHPRTQLAHKRYAVYENKEGHVIA
jgi:hypothetical protein